MSACYKETTALVKETERGKNDQLQTEEGANSTPQQTPDRRHRRYWDMYQGCSDARPDK